MAERLLLSGARHSQVLGVAENCATSNSTLSERDICTKFIIPSLVAAGWDLTAQIRTVAGAKIVHLLTPVRLPMLPLDQNRRV